MNAKAKKRKALAVLADAGHHLIGYGFEDAAVNVARDLLAEAERRVRNGFGPVPHGDAETLLAIENRWQKNCRDFGY